MPALVGCMSVEQAFPRLGVPQFPAQVRRDGCGECSGRNTCFVILNFSGKKELDCFISYTDIYICTQTV